MNKQKDKKPKLTAEQLTDRFRAAMGLPKQNKNNKENSENDKIK